MRLSRKKLFLIVVLTILVLGWFFLKEETNKLPFIGGLNNVFSKLEVQQQLDASVYRLPESSNSRGLNLVFFSDGYLSWEEFDMDVDVILREMKSVEPWRSYNDYNVYKIFPKELDVCGVKIENERKPALRCVPEKINSYLNKLVLTNSFKLVVLSRREFQGWANVVRNDDSGIFISIPNSPGDGNTNSENLLGIEFLHLMGHALGLKDEELHIIAKAGSAVFEPDGPNCAPDRKTAEKWWGDLAKQYPERIGYFWGCSGEEDYIKPTEGSLMNLGDLSDFVPDYGPVSEHYLKKILDYCFSERAFSTEDDPEFFKQYPDFKECLDI